jgi:CheY-like chemotaxis protein
MDPMRTDPSRLRQVLLNLLGNAVKFTEKGQVLLEVEPAQLNGRPAVRFVIRDTGIGISAEQLETLFQPFTQGDHSTTREYGGSGLGLVISRQLCQKMGGDISVESEPGRGSTVTAILPVMAPRADWDRPARVVARPVARVGKGPSTVLVIDDDELACDLLQRFLTKEGFRVATAGGGEEGLRRARELRPALITLDVVMPRMDGWATLKALKADPELSSIPVIMMTIIDNPKLGYSLGASDYVTKPVDWRRLGAALERFRTGKGPP